MPLFEASRHPETFRRLRRNTSVSAVSFAVVAYLLLTEGRGALEIFALTVISTVLAVQVKTLLTSRVPLALYPDRVELRSAMTTTLERAHLKALVPHPKNSAPALDYDDPGKGFGGAVMLPWRFIGESQDTVLDAFKTHYGLQMENAAP